MSLPTQNLLRNIENNIRITNSMKSVLLPTLDIRYSNVQYHLSRLNKELSVYRDKHPTRP